MDVIDIVKDYLTTNGYDGLGCEECSCEIDDLMPCSSPDIGCWAGYKESCNCGECCDFHITEVKE